MGMAAVGTFAYLGAVGEAGCGGSEEYGAHDEVSANKGRRGDAAVATLGGVATGKESEWAVWGAGLRGCSSRRR